MASFRFRYHIAQDVPDRIELDDTLRAIARGATSRDDEELARLYLEQIVFDAAAHDQIESPYKAVERVKELRLLDVLEFREFSTHLVRFEQTHQKVPVYGARTFCELDEGKGLIAAQGELANIEVSPEPKLDYRDALRGIKSDEPLDDKVGEPSLTYYRSPDEGDWHLVYHFSRVPVAPESLLHLLHATKSVGDPRVLRPSVEYFIDANDGSLIHYFSSDALLATDPTDLEGRDEDGNLVKFKGRFDSGSYELFDPWYHISTRDLQWDDVYDSGFQPPPSPIQSPTGVFITAAVTAQANALKIFEFLNSIVKWYGIDGNGGELVNIVNCTCRAYDTTTHEWPQAFWWWDRMWYGQSMVPGGRFVSFARHLDIMAHELMHAVTQHAVGLETAGEPGALNESLSDIFAVIIKNWDWKEDAGGDTSTWDWVIGQNILASGKPLRDIGNPAIANSPEHMAGYDRSGDVHKNSAIHSKAAFNLLTKSDAAGQRIFTPSDIAVLYYRSLLKLGPQSGFGDALGKLIDSARSKYRFRTEVMDEKIAAIESCYGEVGITLT